MALRIGPLAALFALLLDFGTQPASAADAGEGARVASLCASCHRLDGADEGIPTVIGIEPKALIATMGEFKSGARVSQIMHAVAISLTDDELAAVADYLSEQTKGAAK